MGARRLAACAAVGAVLATAGISAGAPTPTRTTTPTTATATAARLIERQLVALARMGLPRASLAAAVHAAGLGDGGVVFVSGQPTSEQPASLDLAGRLVGGHEVALETRYPFVHGKPQVQLTARLASTGRPLWTRTDRVTANSFEVPLPALTGRARTPGVVVLRTDFAKTQGGLRVTMTLTGLTGSGRLLWRHEESGSFDGDGETTMPQLLGGFGTGRAESDALLLGRESATTDSSGNQTITLTMLQLSTATGRVTQLGPSASSATGEPFATTTDDLTGDRYSDVLLTVPGKGVEARNGHGGATDWTNTSATLGQGGYASTVGDLTPSPTGRAAAPEVAVASGPPPPGVLESLPMFVQTNDPTAPAHGTVTLLNGADGSAIWSKTADDFFTVLSAGANHAPAVGITSSTTSYDTTGYGSTTETLTLSAYDVTGNQLFTHDYSISVNGDGSGFSDGFGDAFTFDDWEPDGSLDGLAYLDAFDGGNDKNEAIPFHGVDGTPYAVTGQPLYASTTGHGGDFVVVSTKNGVTITVRRGRDMRSLFARRVPGTAGVTATNTYGDYPTGTHRADVLSCGVGDKTAYCAELSPTGRIRWVVHYRPTRAPDNADRSA